MTKFLGAFGRGFKDGLKEEPSTKWQLWAVAIMLLLAAIRLSYPHPPADADFLYSIGWYASYVAGSVGNLFR